MRGMIQGPGWPVADTLIPGGTIIDFSLPQWAGRTPPINTQALDDACYQFMKQHYGGVGYGHLLGPPPPSTTKSKSKRGVSENGN